jgi:hypothetical protein
MPAQPGVGRVDCNFIVCGSRKSSLFSRSATTIAGFTVGREVHVVRIGDHYLSARLGGLRIDRRQVAREALLTVVRDPQDPQIPRRDDVLWLEPDLEAVHDVPLLRINDVDCHHSTPTSPAIPAR